MLSIITDLFGPIFAKEMVEMSRRCATTRTVYSWVD